MIVREQSKYWVVAVAFGKKDAMPWHPTDEIQWRNFDRKHKDFAAEVRNIRFGLSTDGINPFGGDRQLT
jgi:hypothetical protein